MKSFLIHYSEIALKKNNRSFFEEALRKRIERELNKIGPCKVRRPQGRLLASFVAPPEMKLASESLSKIFGVANFIPCESANATIEELKQCLRPHLHEKKFATFAVRAKRADKNFPVSSQYINEEIGRFVELETKAKVHLDDPETTIHIELFEDKIFFGLEKIQGLGGLPVGIAGRVASLLSGGIDSPVSTWRMMKRGCEVVFIHFHSAPLTSLESEEKALDLAEILSHYQEGGIFLSIPFGEIQRQIVAKAQESYRILLYRRMMMRIAEVLAKEYRCMGLVTGDSLSQVASQTLSNLATIESVVDIPVYRPLIGMDKNEIVIEAKKIGTFETSIRPHPDCCSLMIPKRPRTNSRPEILESMEKDLAIDSWVEMGVKNAKVYEL